MRAGTFLRTFELSHLLSNRARQPRQAGSLLPLRVNLSRRGCATQSAADKGRSDSRAAVNPAFRRRRGRGRLNGPALVCKLAAIGACREVLRRIVLRRRRSVSRGGFARFFGVEWSIVLFSTEQAWIGLLFGDLEDAFERVI